MIPAQPLVSLIHMVFSISVMVQIFNINQIESGNESMLLFLLKNFDLLKNDHYLPVDIIEILLDK
jgi:hypothetical protein